MADHGAGRRGTARRTGEQARGGGARSLLREVLAETGGLLAPRHCPCGRERTRLCPDCAAELAGPPRRVESRCEVLQVLADARVRPGGGLPAGVDLAPLLPVLALGPYRGRLRDLVLGWKNGGALHLARPLAAALAPAVRELAAVDVEGVEGAEPVLLVPAPSSRAARIRRGEDHVAELAQELSRTGVAETWRGRLRTPVSQHGRSGVQRRSRHVELGRGTPLEGRAVVLLDDVVTTGATLRALHAALTAAGARVQGAMVLAAARWPEEPGTDGTSIRGGIPDLPGTPRGMRSLPGHPEDRVAH